MDDRKELLKVVDLHVSLRNGDVLSEVVRGVSFEIKEGDFLSLVGESGCGKSMVAMSLTNLPPTMGSLKSGSIRFLGEELLNVSKNKLNQCRRKGGIAYIFQDPITALNPVLSIKTQLEESIDSHLSKQEKKDRVKQLLADVGLPESVANSYPCELSGGMCQRVCIAMALASEPKLLIADEPTTALDVITQKKILELLVSLKNSKNISIMLITHNLALVSQFSEYVAVMYAGRIVERGTVKEIVSDARHPYTKGLINAIPRLDGGDVESLGVIPGRVPPVDMWKGCVFADRCTASSECVYYVNKAKGVFDIPLLKGISTTHSYECEL